MLFRSPHHPQHPHGMARRSHTKTKEGARDQNSTRPPSPPPRRPPSEHETSPDPPIREGTTPGARRHRSAEHRRGGERAPAHLFHAAAATSTQAAPTGNLTLNLLSTSLEHRSEVPPLPHRRTDGRRGREPPIWPSAEHQNRELSLFAFPPSSRSGNTFNWYVSFFSGMLKVNPYSYVSDGRHVRCLLQHLRKVFLIWKDN